MFALPKGLVDPGEKPQAAALREVREETGIVAEPVTKLADNKYVYVRTWGDGKRVFKIVSFYLMRYVSGEIDNLTSDMRIEVKRALWVPLADAAGNLPTATNARCYARHRTIWKSQRRDTASSARSIAFFSSLVNRRTAPFFRSHSSSGPIDTRTRRNTPTPSASSRRRICRFLPSSR